MSGPPPKPTHLKRLEGNPGKRPLNENEPQPQVSRPNCPAILQGPARTEWNRIVPELEALGLLSRLDRAALAMYCIAWGQVMTLQKTLKGQSPIIKTPNGAVIDNPLISQRDRAMKLAHKFLTEFGMTPSSRSRISVDPSAGEKDDLEALLDECTAQFGREA